VQVNQACKSNKIAEVIYLAPLELLHLDIFEVDAVSRKGGKKYFMTLIDDSMRYCNAYLLKFRLSFELLEKL
jgi:hypothetical protein